MTVVLKEVLDGSRPRFVPSRSLPFPATCDRKVLVNRQRLAGIVLALVAAILAFIFTGFAVALIAAWIVFHEYQHGARGD
jgi:hypothetical protein